jgi:hypothetical protein
VTHPFHPLHGREWELLTCRHNWGEDRVYFHDDGGCLRSMPATWTSVKAADPAVACGAGRSPFRVADLLELTVLLDGLRSEEPGPTVRRRRSRGVR